MSQLIFGWPSTFGHYACYRGSFFPKVLRSFPSSRNRIRRRRLFTAMFCQIDPHSSNLIHDFPPRFRLKMRNSIRVRRGLRLEREAGSLNDVHTRFKRMDFRACRALSGALPVCCSSAEISALCACSSAWVSPSLRQSSTRSSRSSPARC